MVNRMLVAAVCAAIAVAAPRLSAEEAPAPMTDGEVWNQGVDFYRAGDVTNALRVLRPLVLSKTHGARAAEAVAKLCHERAASVAGDEALRLLEEAASAAQLALRASPEDARANRNFTRATDRLPTLREECRVASVLRAAQGKDPGAMLRSAAVEARQLMAGAAGYATNAPERAVALADLFSARATRLADVWLPVRELIVHSVTNQEQAQTILLQIENAQGKTRKAAEDFADLKVDAYAAMSDVEHDVTRFMKMTVLPPAAMDEDLVAQSNAWQDVEDFNGRSWQQDALDFTRAFRAKFPAWARAYEQQAQADTNRPPFSAEDQAKVSALATELEKLQLACCETILPPKQEEAVSLILQIRDLLPKDGNSGGSSRQEKQEPSQSPSRPQPDSSPQEASGQPSDTSGEDREESREEDAGKEAEDGAESEVEPSEEEKDVEAVLRKAQERNDEHEDEKRARMRKAPLPPNERDW